MELKRSNAFASVVGGLLKTQEYALALSSLSGYNCQFITLDKGIEQKLPRKVTGLVSIGYSPFSYNKVIKITTAPKIEEFIDAWWYNNISLRLDDEGFLCITQTGWESMTFRVVSL